MAKDWQVKAIWFYTSNMTLSHTLHTRRFSDETSESMKRSLPEEEVKDKPAVMEVDEKPA